MIDIQYINNDFENGTHNFGNFKVKINDFDTVESIDEFQINILDLSGGTIWATEILNKNLKDCKKINIIADAFTQSYKSELLVLLPGNIKIDINYLNTHGTLSNNLDYLYKEIFGYFPFNQQVLIEKTKYKFNKSELYSDFYFKTPFDNYANSKAITFSNKSEKIITIREHNIYYTFIQFNHELKLILDYVRFIFDKFGEDSCPEWVKDFKFYNEKDLIIDKSNIENKILNLRDEIDIISDKLSEIDKCKGLLYKNGEELEWLVKYLLSEITSQDIIEYEEKYKEDFSLEYINKENEVIYFVGEIKGVNKNVKKQHLYECAYNRDDFSEGIEVISNNVLGLLIINPQRNTEPKNRDIISKDVIEMANKLDIIIITTIQLLKIYEQFLMKKINKDDFYEKIIDSKGLIAI